MTQNGPKWPKMVQNDPKWPKMAQNDPKWHCSPRSWNLTCSKTEVNLSSAWVTRLECPKGVKDEVKQARRAKRVAEGHQLEIGAQRAPRFLVINIFHQLNLDRIMLAFEMPACLSPSTHKSRGIQRCISHYEKALKLQNHSRIFVIWDPVVE